MIEIWGQENKDLCWQRKNGFLMGFSFENQCEISRIKCTKNDFSAVHNLYWLDLVKDVLNHVEIMWCRPFAKIAMQSNFESEKREYNRFNNNRERHEIVLPHSESLKISFGSNRATYYKITLSCQCQSVAKKSDSLGHIFYLFIVYCLFNWLEHFTYHSLLFFIR